MIINAQNIAGLRTGFSMAFNQGFEGVEVNYSEIATVVPSATSEQHYSWLGQIPNMKEWIGDREIQNLSQYDYSIKNKNFEMTVSVNRSAIEDDQYGVYTPLMRFMGESAARHPEQLVFEALKNGFTEKCYDGKAFFAKDHASGKDGGTAASNLGDKKLSSESYSEARKNMMMLTGEQGKSLGIVPNLLIVSPALEEEGRKILEAEFIDGSSNILRGTAKLMVSTELSDKESYWFLVDNRKFLKPLIYQERKKIVFVNKDKETDDNVFMRNEYIYGAEGRSNAGYGFWQMAFGSTGTKA